MALKFSIGHFYETYVSTKGVHDPEQVPSISFPIYIHPIVRLAEPATSSRFPMAYFSMKSGLLNHLITTMVIKYIILEYIINI